MPVIYQGKRTRDGVTVTYKRNDSKPLPLRLSPGILKEKSVSDV